MRGKRVARDRGGTRVRIIPAHAGQTQGPFRGIRHETDHPRACGTNMV